MSATHRALHLVRSRDLPVGRVAASTVVAVVLGLGLLALGRAGPDRGPVPPVAAQQGDADLPHHLHLPLAARRAALADLPTPAIVTPPTPTEPPTATAAPTPTDTAPPTPAEPTPTPVICKPLAERVRITSTQLGRPIRANDEYFPLPLAPKPGGGALVAWREQAGPTVRVAGFDAEDRMVGTPLSFAAEEVHALVAHEDGGAMVVAENDPDIYSPKYCRGPSTPDKALCAKLDLWRFDEAGRTDWRTTVTKKTNVDANGAHFIWWYQHTARLAWNGREYGLYYRAADSSPRPGTPGEIDIHTGDAFRFLDGRGQVLPGQWAWGCSHSWAVRLADNGHFGTACHGDAYPNAFHFVVMDRERRLGDSTLHDNLDPTKRALGGLVPAAGGFWILHMAQAAAMELHLAFVDNTGKVTEDKRLDFATQLETPYPFRAYLAEYGVGAMLAGWLRAGTLQLAVLDKTTGELADGPVGVPASIDKWSELTPYPNGDVGWAWSTDRSAKLDLVRVESCAGGG